MCDKKIRFIKRTSNGLEHCNCNFNGLVTTSHNNLVTFTHALHKKVNCVIQMMDDIVKGQENTPDYDDPAFPIFQMNFGIKLMLKQDTSKITGKKRGEGKKERLVCNLAHCTRTLLLWLFVVLSFYVKLGLHNVQKQNYLLHCVTMIMSLDDRTSFWVFNFLGGMWGMWGDWVTNLNLPTSMGWENCSFPIFIFHFGTFNWLCVTLFRYALSRKNRFFAILKISLWVIYQNFGNFLIPLVVVRLAHVPWHMSFNI